MATEHRARITWSAEHERRGLPDVLETIDPAWLPEVGPGKGEAWSLVCRFAVSPRVQGNPSAAQVHFGVDEAPHARLVPGTRLQLFERGTQRYATVTIE